MADVPALPGASRRRARPARRGRALGSGDDRARRGDRQPLGPPRGAARARNRRPARGRAGARRGEPARGLGAHGARRRGGAGRLPGRARPRRGARRARRARRGERGRGAPRDARPGARASVGAGGREAVRRDPRASTQIDEEAGALLEQAASEHRELGLRFASARALLVLGRSRRRRRKWARARSALEEAAAAFDAMGSPGWAAEARSELSRVGGGARPPRGS